MTRLIVGCGYLGQRVARLWSAEGHHVVGLTRSPERARQLEEDGLQSVVADVTRPETLAALPPAGTVLYSVGYDGRHSASRRAVYVQGLQAVLDRVQPDAERVIQISSTGVYGQTDGSWVDENSACEPRREGGQVMVEAENALRTHRLADRGIILRLAGIYGPGRIPRAADVQAGRPIASEPGGHLNLIHVDDAAEVVVTADRLARPPRTYIVADGSPIPRREFYIRLAELLGAPAPQFVEPAPGDRSLRRGGTDKRASNSRMLEELGVVLRYPSYREGLTSVVAGQRDR